MTRPSRRAVWTAYGFVLLSAATGFVLWPWLPERMVIHFSVAGSPDATLSRPLALVIVPAVGLVTVPVVARSVTLDPDPPARPAVDGGVVLTAGFVSYLQGLVLAWNLGVRFDVTLVAVVPTVAAAGLFVGCVRWRGWDG